MQDGRKWRFVISPSIAAKIVPAGGELRLPYQNHVYTHEEMILMVFAASFDSPTCGMRIKTEPNFDTGAGFIISTLLAGGLNLPETQVYVRIPPDTAPGTFTIRLPSYWICLDALELSLINSDTVDHNCFTVAYLIAVTDDKRKEK